MELGQGARLAHEHLDDLRAMIRHKTRRIVGRYGYVAGDLDDLENELLADLIKRLDKFNESIAQLNTFADRLVTRQIATLIQHRLRQRRDRRREEPFADVGTLAAPDDAQADSDFQIDFNDVLAELPPDLKGFCEHLLVNNLSELARATQRERGDLRGVVETLRRRFADAGLKIYLANCSSNAVCDE